MILGILKHFYTTKNTMGMRGLYFSFIVENSFIMANWFVRRNFQFFHENLKIMRSFSHLMVKNILFDAIFGNDLNMF